jgi:hypothetical protein
MTGNEKPHAGGRGVGNGASEQRFRVDHASAEPLLQRLEALQRQGNGWRARCPACGGTSRKVAIAERDGRVLVHCFAGCRGDDVLTAVGLRWADLHPPRHWPQSREERERARQAIREAGIVTAVEVLAFEASIIEAAGRQLYGWQYLSVEDDKRLSEAVERVANARSILSRPQPWRAAA